MLSAAIEESDSAVQERRTKTRPVRNRRKGGIWNSVAELIGTSTPRSRNGPEELPTPRDRGSSFGRTLRRASSADSFNASPRAAQPDCTSSLSVMALLARHDASAGGRLVKEDSPPLLAPNATCRSRSSPAVLGNQSPCNDTCGSDAPPINAGPRLPRRSPSPEDGAPAAWRAESDGHSNARSSASTTLWHGRLGSQPDRKGGTRGGAAQPKASQSLDAGSSHRPAAPPGMGLFGHHGVPADFVSQLVEDDPTPDSVMASAVLKKRLGQRFARP